MSNEKRKEALIKKISKIYKRGYLPSRKQKEYSQLFTKPVNCFGHACFNLSDRDLKQLEDYIPELDDYFRQFGNCGVNNYFKIARDRIEQVGLQVEKSYLTEKLKFNQWRIAYYVYSGDEFYSSDLHFMIQGKNGVWYSKRGRRPEIEKLDELPEVYRDEYQLIGIYKITNPYAKPRKQKTTTKVAAKVKIEEKELEM